MSRKYRAFVLGCIMAGLAGIIASPLTTIDPLIGPLCQDCCRLK